MKKPSIDKIRKIIIKNYTVSLMSDSKWIKLIDTVTDLSEVFINYKLIYSSNIYSTKLISSDVCNFFIEPIFYREIEWIEFPMSYDDYISIDNRKAGFRKYEQDIEAMEKVILTIGQFEIEHSRNAFKVYGYK